MQILDAIVAFALTMLIMSMIVAAVVEGLHQAGGLRKRGMRSFLEALYDNVLWQRFKAIEGKKDSEQKEERQKFVDLVVRSRGISSSIPRRQDWIAKLTGLGDPAVISLTTVQFAERLAMTDVGKALGKAGQKQGEKFLEEQVNFVLRAFDSVGEEGRDHFKGRAQAISMAVAIVLAFLFNIDAARLFMGFVRDPALVATWVKEGQTILAHTADIQKRQETSGQKNLPLPDAGKAPASKDGLPAASASGFDDAARRLNDVSERMLRAADDGLPIGPLYYPFCQRDTSGQLRDPTCKRILAEIQERQPRSNGAATPTPKAIKGEHDTGIPAPGFLAILAVDWGTAAKWATMTLLAGLLIGLGGPFWYERLLAFSKISRVASALGTVLDRFKKPAEEGKDSVNAPPPGGPKAPEPKSVFEAFKAVYDVHHGPIIEGTAAKAAAGGKSDTEQGG
ncbi:MAG: hypothetical protein H7841_12720 [Magnetospirillum sp. WYHS-4]